MKDLAERRAARRAVLASATPEAEARVEARRVERRANEARLWAEIDRNIAIVERATGIRF